MLSDLPWSIELTVKPGLSPSSHTWGLWGLSSLSEATPPGQPCCKERVSLQQVPRMPAPELGYQVR